MKYFSIISAAFTAVLMNMVSFRFGSKQITLSGGALYHVTFGDAIKAVELAVAGTDGTFPLTGSLSITIAEWAPVVGV